jgi:phosphate transport system permease protein
MGKSQSFSGRSRQRKTRRSVILTDRAAGVLIAMGGIGTIVAVLTVCVFLVWVVVPLFFGATIERAKDFVLAAGREDSTWSARDDDLDARPLRHFQVDEHLTMGWAFLANGSVVSINLIDGSILETLEPFAGPVDGPLPVCWSFSLDDPQCAFGFEDGTVRLGQAGFATEFLERRDVPETLQNTPLGTAVPYENGMLERTPENQFRRKTLRFTLDDPVAVSEHPVVAIDQSPRPTGPVFGALTADGTLSINSVRQRRNLLTGEVVTTLSGGKVAVAIDAVQEPPAHLLLSGLGDNVFLLWESGRLMRFECREGDPRLVEELRVVDSDRTRLTAAAFLIGKTTLVTGDSDGRVRAWFRVKPASAETLDGELLVCAHELPAGRAAVTALRASARSRMLAGGFADGTVRLYHVTANQLLGEAAAATDGDTIRSERVDDLVIDDLVLAPKEDALLAVRQRQVTWWRVRAPHAGITLASILRPVWYEGHEKPEHVWQSSSGTDDFEPKYGLYPLIFGTLKATFYSMLFGAPLALLAAIYTSEFLHPRIKSRVKPLVEMMASLPSVILGFLAALVIAPWVEGFVPEVITFVFVLPVTMIGAGFLWQLLPKRLALPGERFRIPLMVLVVPAAGCLAWPIARPIERLLFSGDIKGWLDGQVGTGWAGWLLLLLPLSGLCVVFWFARTVNARLRRLAAGWSHQRFAWLDLAKFAAGVAVTVLLAAGAGWVLTWCGLDPRGSFVDTYVQRNAMIVGFVMGFAVIPIIYTIAEDALSAVPEHLRAASLGAGATPWQTAMRIIVPTALSGLFSAVMVGLGRAVGETMIVLMAAGNTPVTDWNIFNGFRTLSANIAVELPEAVQNSTHYRMLFLAALALFAMTFVVNTVAEIVRSRFRRRAFEL